jgi:hypothetical protein
MSVTEDTRLGMILLQKLSAAVQQGCAACILRTVIDEDNMPELAVFQYLMKSLYILSLLASKY